MALVDYRMPRLEGLELLADCFESAPEMLIAVYTADADQSIVVAVFEAGAHALILKDAPLTDLGQALGRSAPVSATWILRLRRSRSVRRRASRP